MTTRTWSGTTSNFSDASSWAPIGVPISGDTAVISSGTVSTSGTISGVTIDLNESGFAKSATTLALNSTTLDAATSLVVTADAPPAISVTGTSTIAGTASF